MLKHCFDRWSHALKGEFWKLMVQGSGIVVASILFPMIQGGFAKHVSSYSKMEDTVLVFSRSVGRTFSYFDSVVINGYNLHQVKGGKSAEGQSSKYENLVNDKFEKMMSIDPAYDVACAMIQIHFDGDISQKSRHFCDKFKVFVEKQWWLDEGLDAYDKTRDALVNEYTSLQEDLTDSLKLRRSKSAFF